MRGLSQLSVVARHASMNPRERRETTVPSGEIDGIVGYSGELLHADLVERRVFFAPQTSFNLWLQPWAELG